MVLLNEGLERLATLFSSDITKGQWGTGTTLPTQSDTGLETPVAATLLDVTSSSSGNSSQFTHTVTSALGNGNDLTEFELQFGNGDSFKQVCRRSDIKNRIFRNYNYINYKFHTRTISMVNNPLNNQQTRDEIGSEPSIHEIYKIKTEEVNIFITNQSKSDTIGHSWIVGSSTNGIVGANTGTQDGQQQVVGSAGRIDTFLRVLSPNGTFFDDFNYDNFIDSSTTADVDTANSIVNFTDGEVLLSELIYFDTANISKIKVSGTTTGTLSFELSADNGTTWTEIELDTEYILSGSPSVFPLTFPILFTNGSIGNQVIYRATSSGVSTISDIKIIYS
jgi:hypothetical protein